MCGARSQQARPATGSGGCNTAHLLAALLWHIRLHDLLVAKQQLHAAAGVGRAERGRRRDGLGLLAQRPAVQSCEKSSSTLLQRT